MAGLLAAFLLPLPTQAQNQATSSAIASGVSNNIQSGANYSFIGSGWRNRILTNAAMGFIGSGMSNTIRGNWSVINGGYSNVISPNDTNGQMSFIGGGAYNRVDSKYAAINAGYSNTISDTSASGAVIGGGHFNTNVAPQATIGGGSGNLISSNIATGATVSGGLYNEASRPGATIPGGFANKAAGSNSFAAGFRALATNAGTFVWGDMSTNDDFLSSSNNQFLIRAAGGVGINTNKPGTNALLVNGSAWVTGNLIAANINGQTNFTGPAGTNGTAATIAIGSVTTGAPGSNAVVTNVGTSNAAVFNFTIPQGLPGASGTNGAPGTPGLNGTNGAPGAAATIAIGSVTTAPPGSNAAVTNTGTSNAAVLNFTIPQGPYGITGGAGAGTNNSASGDFSFVGGGQGNQATTNWATVTAGISNVASRIFSSIGGGLGNKASGDGATVPGGQTNEADGDFSAVGGGQRNTTTANSAVISGGLDNTNSGFAGTIGGGSGNTASFEGATVAGGQQNSATGYMSVVSGGFYNVAGHYASVPGGQGNTASGNISFAAGQHARALHDGAFVWSGSITNFDDHFDSTAPKQFLIRAAGGVGINTNDPGTNALSVNGPVQIGTIQVLTGSGDPTIEAANGSIYLKTDGGQYDTLWIRAGGVWHPVISGLPPA